MNISKIIHGCKEGDDFSEQKLLSAIKRMDQDTLNDFCLTLMAYEHEVESTRGLWVTDKEPENKEGFDQLQEVKLRQGRE